MLRGEACWLPLLEQPRLAAQVLRLESPLQLEQLQQAQQQLDRHDASPIVPHCAAARDWDVLRKPHHAAAPHEAVAPQMSPPKVSPPKVTAAPILEADVPPRKHGGPSRAAGGA